MTKFELAGYFTRICGAAMDGVRDSTDAVIAYLLETLPQDVVPVMVGDPVLDVEGAKVHGIPTIGVTWGYGDAGEMEKAGAVALVDSPSALKTVLFEQFFQKSF